MECGRPKKGEGEPNAKSVIICVFISVNYDKQWQINIRFAVFVKLLKSFILFYEEGKIPLFSNTKLFEKNYVLKLLPQNWVRIRR